MLYATQIKGLCVYANADLASGDNTASSYTSYMNNTFNSNLYQQLVQFNRAVNYLAVNLVDYRNQGQFNSDNKWIAPGIATDTLYQQRSRPDKSPVLLPQRGQRCISSLAAAFFHQHDDLRLHCRPVELRLREILQFAVKCLDLGRGPHLWRMGARKALQLFKSLLRNPGC